MRVLRAAAAAWLAGALPAGAQAPPLSELTLEALLELPVVEVAGEVPLPAREAPGVVTVLTREQILDSGARDLIDVLRLVPGLFFGVDVQGMTGAGFRGIWGHEGKILLLVDGQEFNELDYGTLQLGNRFPVDQIQRVEVLRGPGSARYGGFAELAVISVVTRAAEELRGVSASAVYGRMEAGLGRRNLGLAAGGAPRPELAWTLSGLLGQGWRSDGVYRDFSGRTASLASDAALDPRWLNASLRWRELSVRFIHDGYWTTTADGFGDVAAPVVQTFPSYYGEARYRLRLGEAVALAPRFNYKRQTPWLIRDKGSPLFADRTVERLTAGLDASWDAAPGLKVTGGLEGYEDRARLNDLTLTGLQRSFEGGADSVRYRNLALYGEVFGRHPLGTLTAGLRYETHSKYGSSAVPRLVFARAGERFHGKAMLASSFRAPVFQNINLNPAVRPERTQTVELEGGVRVVEGLYAGLNLYEMAIVRPIVFTSQIIAGQAVEGYENQDRTGTRGAELEVHLQRPGGYGRLAYSFYTAAGKNRVPTYAVPGRSAPLLGSAQHQVSLLGAIKAWGPLRVSPSAVWLGPRYGFVGTGTVGRFGAELLVNLHLRLVEPLPGLEAGLGVQNVLDRQVAFLQPYDGGHAPLPGPTREYVLRLSYHFGVPGW